jgi:hypothetical protein
LLHFTQQHQADILLVQGLNDTPIQLYSWPTFKQDMQQNNTTVDVLITEIPGAGHASLFATAEGKTALNNFLSSH